MGLFDKFTAMRQRSKDKNEFLQSVIAAADDGKVTEQEMNEIQSGYKRLGLDKDDLKGIRAHVYAVALRAATSDGVVTREEEAELAKLQKFLMIPEAEIAGSKKQLARLRLLAEIQSGNPPAIRVENVVLQKSEKPYWSEPGSLLEERVVRRRYEGGSSGVSIRIMKGVSYRVGSHQGHIISDKAVIPVSSGQLVITSKRVIFAGDMKSFNLRLDKLLELKLCSDGIRLTNEGGKAKLVQFDHEGNADIIGATLTHAINNFGDEAKRP